MEARADGRVLPSFAEHLLMIPSSLVSAIIGVVIGAVPGAGGDIASIISWDVAKRMSKHKEDFGKGSLEGVGATCTSNNTSIDGALTTALCLGVPGDSNTAVLLLCVIGAYALNKNYFDVLIMFAAGVLGFFFRKMDFPLGPLILGLLLGKICESNMRRAMALSMGNYGIFVGSPVCIILLAAMVAVLFGPYIIAAVKKGKK